MSGARLNAMAIETEADAPSLTPDMRVLFAGAAATASLSFYFLPTPAAIASSLLGALMIAGADVDARVYLLPDAVTLGGTACGIAAAFFLTPEDPWMAMGLAGSRAFIVALTLFALREIHRRVRGVEGLGLGDVKLAAAIGAWLTLDLAPLCFALAAIAALASVALRARRFKIETVRVPFGAFLCPALWLVFFVSALPS